MCCKGIESATHERLSSVAASELDGNPTAILSGPSFALDVAEGRPAAVTLASTDVALAEYLARALSHRLFRIYWSDDVAGVELGGAIKNVLAIASGIVIGSGLGASAQAALVTRGFAEMNRVGLALGARPETLAGLSGLGDLMLTSSSTQSRNMSLGLALGRGEKIEDYLKTRRTVSEGVATSQALVGLADQLGIDLPIARAVADIVTGRATRDEAIGALLSRPLKSET